MGEEGQSDVIASASNPVTWEEIELAESYLVSGMFEEAGTLASSVLTRINVYQHADNRDECPLHEMMISAAMVLVQSWKESGRASNLLGELENYFGSVTAIPIQVILTGACIQVSSDHSSGVRTFLENFLSKWKFDNEKYYAMPLPAPEKTDSEVHNGRPKLEFDEYLEIVEFYALTLLGTVINDVDHAVLWVENAQLPEEARQDLFRRLLSLSHLKSTSSMQDSVPPEVVEELECYPLSVKEVKQSDKPMMVLSTQCHHGQNGKKRSIWRRFQNFIKRSSNAVVASNGKLLLGCLVFLICYFIRKKRDTLVRVLRRRALSLKQALVDLWQLAFSYHVNPLAAVQPLPASANISR